MGESPQEHLLYHLRDIHALELQAIRQLERAALRRDGDTSALYGHQLEQSREHEQKIAELVKAHGHEPSAVEDKTLRGRAIGLRQLADIALDTPVKLAMNLFALEHLQIAAYELLAELARAADDEETERLADEFLKHEREAIAEVEETFDHAAAQLLEGGADEDLLLPQLIDVHALERQSGQILQLAVDEVCQDEQLKQTYAEHLEQTEEHERQIAERIEARDAKPSAVKDLHLGAAKSGLHDLAAQPPDAEAKMAMNLFCIEALEIAAYELLIRLAEHEGDDETAGAARSILEQERHAAEAIQGEFGRCVELMLASDSSYESVMAAERPQDESGSPS